MYDARAFIFVPTLAATAVFGLLVAAYAAHVFMVVLQQTAAGAKEVEYPDEPITDWFWKVYYLTWIAFFWVGPAMVMARVFSRVTHVPVSLWVVALAFFWLLFPFGLFSSLGSGSKWVPFSFDVLRRFALKPGALVGFYFLSAFVVALGGAGAWAVFGPKFVSGKGLLIGVPALAAAWLLYPRLLGRLAFHLAFIRPMRQKPKRDSGEPPLPAHMKKRKPRRAELEEDEEFVPKQPSELPPVQTPFDGELVGYDVRFNDATPADPEPEPARKRPTYVEIDDEPIEMSGPKRLPTTKVPAALVEPSALELRLLERSHTDRPPETAWGDGLFGAMLSGKTFARGAVIGMGFALMGVFAIVLRTNYPS